MADGMPQMMDNGMPVMMVALVPRDEVKFTDGWHVQGLKGTGSYDYELHDVFVPESRTYTLFCREPQRCGSADSAAGAGHEADTSLVSTSGRLTRGDLRPVGWCRGRRLAHRSIAPRSTSSETPVT